MTVSDIADALGVTQGRVRQIVGSDRTFPPPVQHAAIGRARRWDSRDIQTWADMHGRTLTTSRPPVPDDLWTPPETPPDYLGYRLVSGHDVMTFASPERKVALAQRRSGFSAAPTPSAVDADVVVEMNEYEIGGSVLTKWGEAGDVMRSVFARWLTGQGGSGRMPWWKPEAVTPEMLSGWRPGDPPLPVTVAEAAASPLWRLLADEDPDVVAFARSRLTLAVRRIGGPPDLGGISGCVEPIHAVPDDSLDPTPSDEVLVPVNDDVDDVVIARGAQTLLWRRDAAAMNRQIAGAARDEALEWTRHPKVSLSGDGLRRFVGQWQRVTATSAHLAMLPDPDRDASTAEFYRDPWLNAPSVVTTDELIVSAWLHEPLPPFDIGTVRLPGTGMTPVITATDGRIYLVPESTACGYKGSGPITLTHHLMALIHGGRKPGLPFRHFGALRQTALAEFLESKAACEPGRVLTGEQVRDLASRPRDIKDDN